MPDTLTRMTSPAADPIAVATARLLTARRTGVPQPVPDLPDAAAAYAVQDRVAAALGSVDGEVPRHWKSGGPSRGAVATHAPLPPAGVWASPGDASARGWPIVQARVIEAEVALRLGVDVDPARAAALDGVEDARPLVDAICVSIELCDFRWIGGADAPPLARLADLQSHAALVLGPWRPWDRAMADRDWSRQRVEVRIGQAEPFVFTGTHALGDPAWVLPAWLRHATRGGSTLPAGTVVTTGTWCGMRPAARGDRVDVVFDGIGEARLQL
jgi:2-keto-4-pentenoate hydratase